MDGAGTGVDAGGATVSERIPVPGTFNLRDVGGLPVVGGGMVRRGVLFRSDALCGLGDAGRVALGALGLRTVVDMRTVSEVEAEPDDLDGLGPALVHRPIYRERRERAAGVDLATVTLESIYQSIVSERGEALAAVVGELARPDALPGLVHCTAGKDRTGITVALVLSLAGVADEVVAADFAATSRFLTDEYRDVLRGRSTMSEMDAARMASFMGCQPELIDGVLATVRRDHGGVREYLVHYGLDGPSLDRLVGTLVEV